ncbi:MBL fold metallo-hydrolase [Vallitalea guaymasensis]|uniref:MBL fold metallo-hydrolase n=1 Tax=Vallitalea guaymasensis TaxID=1185412 RepID=A0A8J8MCB5_9FIRM|nr:MBL fold metallo-hydrolase [Vallitalea guaymasensis]QUH30347.1 MBL fold metallo-hydrolase [Vallitalea guaymasensis]
MIHINKLKVNKLENVYVYTELISGFFNNVSVIDDEELILIDTFKTRELMEELMENISDTFNRSVSKIIYTHWHIDHTLGSHFISNASIISTNYTNKYLEKFISNDLERLVNRGIIENGAKPKLSDVEFEEIYNIELFKGKKLVIKHLPGHTYDSLVVFYEDILIVGDTLLGNEVDVFKPPVIPPDAPLSKEEHLETAIEFINNSNVVHIITGHGYMLPKIELIQSNLNRLKNII